MEQPERGVMSKEPVRCPRNISGSVRTKDISTMAICVSLPRSETGRCESDVFSPPPRASQCSLSLLPFSFCCFFCLPCFVALLSAVSDALAGWAGCVRLKCSSWPLSFTNPASTAVISNTGFVLPSLPLASQLRARVRNAASSLTRPVSCCWFCCCYCCCCVSVFLFQWGTESLWPQLVGVFFNVPSLLLLLLI